MLVYRGQYYNKGFAEFITYAFTFTHFHGQQLTRGWGETQNDDTRNTPPIQNTYQRKLLT
jgi:hypothetical protein